MGPVNCSSHKCVDIFMSIDKRKRLDLYINISMNKHVIFFSIFYSNRMCYAHKVHHLFKAAQSSQTTLKNNRTESEGSFINKLMAIITYVLCTSIYHYVSY